MKRFLILSLCLATLFTSCDKNDQHQSIYGKGFSLSIDPKEKIKFSPVGEELTFSITAGERLALRRVQDDNKKWLDLYIDGKTWLATSSSLTYNIDEGYHEIRLVAYCPGLSVSKTKLSATLSISSSSGTEQLEIEQEYPYFEFVGEPQTKLEWTWSDKYDVGGTEHAKFEINSNVKWKIVSENSSRTNLVEKQDEAELADSSEYDVLDIESYTRAGVAVGSYIVSTSSGNGNGEFELAPKGYNLSNAAVSEDIIVMVDSKKDNLDDSITPLRISNTQKNLKFQLSYLRSDNSEKNIEEGYTLPYMFAPCYALPQLIYINSEDNLTWEVSFGVNPWLSLKSADNDVVTQGNGGSKNEYYIHAAINPTRENRIADVKFTVTSNGATVNRSFKVKQQQYVHKIVNEKNAIVHGGTFRFTNQGNNEDDTKQLYVTSSSSWDSEIVYDSDNATRDWVHIDPNSDEGSNNGSEKSTLISISALTQNPELNKRSATVNINSLKNDLSNSVTIEQAEFIFNHTESALTLHKDDDNTYKIAVTSSGDWTAECNASWINLTKASGTKSKNGTNVEFNATINRGADARTAEIIIKSNYHEENGYAQLYEPLKIQVTQNGSFVVDKSGETLVFGALNLLHKRVTVECLATDGWVIESQPDWIIADPNQSKGPEVTVQLTAKENYTFSERDGSVVFSMWDEEEATIKRRTVGVRQEAYQFSASSTFDEATIPAYNSNKYVRYSATINCSGKWRASSNNTDVKLSRSDTYSESLSSALSDDEGETLYIFVKNNNSVTARNLKVTITSDAETKGGKNPIELSATQYKYLFEVSPTNIEDIPAELENATITRNIKVTCSGVWSVSTTANWLTPNSITNVYTREIAITIAPNPLSTERVGIYTITCKDLNKSIDVKFVQKCVEFGDITPSSLTFNADPVTSQPVTINCSGSWNYDETGSTVKATVNPSSGFGYREGVSILPTEIINYESRDVTKEIYFKNDLTGIKKKVDIILKAYDFGVSSTNDITCKSVGENGTLTVKCTGGWTCTSNCSWLKCEKTNTTTMKWSVVESNTTGKSRECTITITPTNNNKLSPITIKVIQESEEAAD